MHGTFSKKKTHFELHYKGPNGKHLSCMTKFTRQNEVNMSGSMHPGRVLMATNGRKYNPRVSLDTDKQGKTLPITAPRNPNRRGHLARASAALNARRVAYESIKLADQVAYKKPGSMRLT